MAADESKTEDGNLVADLDELKNYLEQIQTVSFCAAAAHDADNPDLNALGRALWGISSNALKLFSVEHAET